VISVATLGVKKPAPGGKQRLDRQRSADRALLAALAKRAVRQERTRNREIARAKRTTPRDP
jgi:hypothetical protein